MKSYKSQLFFALLLTCVVVSASEIVEIQKKIDHLQNKVELLEDSSKKLENLYSVERINTNKFQISYDGVVAQFGGKLTQEMFTAQNTTYLNKSLQNDSIVFLRATSDYYFDFMYGKGPRPTITAHNTLRFRYKWGSGTEVRIFDSNATVVDVPCAVRGTQANKHLLWSREAWIKIALGDVTQPNEHFVQLGVFPYQVGRGISFGPAYQRGGFLGFTPGFSVDQFAPGFLLHINPAPNKASAEFYFAMLENVNTSFKSNNELVRKKEIDACPQRGPGRQSYAAVTKGIWEAYTGEDGSILLEPYIVYFQAPDQKLEFSNDLDSFLTTYGIMVEGKFGKFDWGFEAAINDGNALIKPWDRNTITLARNSDGLLAEKYTKVVTADPAITSNPSTATVTNANKTVVEGANSSTTGVGNISRGAGLNAQEIGNSGLYNTYDRFRPKQNIDFDGYFFIADASYQVIDKVLNVAVGAGYSSGNINEQLDTNKLSGKALNQAFNGFVTLQSVYSGKRLRHLIIFNEGVPRFTTRNPNGTFTNQNITPALSNESIEFTNIAFAGTRAEWKIKQLKNYKVTFAPNVIGYWAVETPDTKQGVQARNYMGTEVTAELSAYAFEKLKVYCYVGLLFPGNYYKDMCGTLIDKQPLGSDVATIVNIGINYVF
ncbi:MAG: hypothetical protein CL947_04355 [Epsilonproteobacteria bacterium]|nr:hypothetical protein [Campylobacterota bacterium]|tara:strand:- start:85 stop:2058 length:1974 start_codon:yes stop_codon:yes gene_type:complete